MSVSPNTIKAVAGVGSSATQVAAAFRSRRKAKSTARLLEGLGDEEAAILQREGVRRRGEARVAFAGSRGGTEGGGVDVNTGSAARFDANDAALTAESAARARLNFTLRAHRIKAEGREEFTAGIVNAGATLTSTIYSLLDIPVETPKPGIGLQLMDLGFDVSEVPLLTGISAPLFSIAPDPLLHLDF